MSIVTFPAAAPAEEPVANTSGPVTVLAWLRVSRTYTEALVDYNGHQRTLIANGPTADYIGGVCLRDVLHVKGVRCGDVLIAEEARLAACADLEPGPTPAVRGYFDPPSSAEQRRAA